MAICDDIGVQQFWESARACREPLGPLAEQATMYLSELPKIRLIHDRKEWAAARLGHPKWALRVRIVFERLESQLRQFYIEFRKYTDLVLAIFRQLSDVLPHHEVERWNASVDPARVGPTCQAVLEAVQRLDEFLECRTDQSAASQHTAERPRPLSREGEGQEQSDTVTAEIKQRLPSQAKRGPKPDMDALKKIAKILAPYGERWKETADLSLIFQKLDSNGVDFPKRWRTKEPRARGWLDGYDIYGRGAVQALGHRYKSAKIYFPQIFASPADPH